MQLSIKLIFIILLSGLLFQCTENPFFKDKIVFNERKTISGNLGLELSVDQSGILVYLESFEIFTETDINGNFTIKIPPAHQQPGDGLTGLYNIYYYVANYKIESSTVLISNGEFVFDIIDLNPQGEINRKIVLKKLLDVSTNVKPKTINHNYDGNVEVGLTLNNRVDSVIVSTFRIKRDDLGSVYFKSPDNVYLFQSINSKLSNLVIKEQTELVMQIKWDLEKDSIAVGNYDVIPFLQVYQEGIPDKMLKYIGENSQIFHLDFLNMPYRRSSNQLIISSPN